MAEQYEYQCHSTGKLDDPKLNEYGRQGFEVYSVMTQQNHRPNPIDPRGPVFVELVFHFLMKRKTSLLDA